MNRQLKFRFMYFCQTIEDAVEIDDLVEVPKRGRPKKIK